MRKHVVFVVDASRSMERRDVVEQGERKRRIDAVLDCCFEFIEVKFNPRKTSARCRIWKNQKEFTPHHPVCQVETA